MLHQKSFYPYSYFDNCERFSGKRLPPLNKWKNTLASGEVSITHENLAHANQVFRTFKCKTLGDYHDLYLTIDNLLLARVFEKFSKVCYETDGLDCAQYFSAANLAGDAYLKTCNINVRLLVERESILIWQKILCAVAGPQFTRVEFSKLTANICSILIKQLRVPLVSQSTQIISGIMQTCCLPIEIRNKIVKVLPNSCWLLHCFASQVPIRAIANEHQELPRSKLLSVLLHGCFPLILRTHNRERRHHLANKAKSFSVRTKRPKSSSTVW